MPLNCEYCGEEIQRGDRVRMVERLDDCTGVMHRNCFLRTIIGSVSHIVGLCGCYVKDSTAGDPPDMTRRQAADEAVHVWEMMRATQNPPPDDEGVITQ